MIKLYVCEISNLIEEIKADEKAVNLYANQLGKERMEYILKKSKAEDRARTLGASLLLLFALKEEGCNLKKLPYYTYLKNGKPHLDDIGNLHFNLSHTKNIITCVISNNEVGVDVESQRNMSQATVDRVFTKKEKQMVQNDTEDFIRMWTMKEAGAKLSGKGLSEILEGLEITEDAEGKMLQKLNQNITKNFCRVTAEGRIYDSLKIPYYYSVCSKTKEEVRPIYVKWEQNQIKHC